MSKTKVLKKSVAATVEHAMSVKKEMRPVRVTFEIVFADGNRKVTPADLERAASAAAAALRASLESRTPAYQIASIKGVVDYAYVLARKAFSG